MDVVDTRHGSLLVCRARARRRLEFGFSELATTHEESVESRTGYARLPTAISWCTQPLVYIIEMTESGVAATAGWQIGHSVADVVAMAVSDVLAGPIAPEESKAS